MIKHLIFGFILHLIFLASIFEIYFQSPVISGLNPQPDFDGGEAPAKRLVLFVADGLRAESFFRNECNRTNFLREIIIEKGVVAISHTRVPTESRPGHVAVIAGLYEDPSAVARGWQENPIDFDSVFNRSQITYSWGSPDIVRIFSKGATPGRVHTKSYNPADEDFSGKSSTTALDLWVFDEVKDFFNNPEMVEGLKKKEKVIFFLHLLGLDTAGHVHKPHSPLFTENLIVVDNGIKEMVELIERSFENDGKTAFLMTSDHGMTDRGSHGSGLKFETETPFVAWGAGIRQEKLFNSLNENEINFHMEQAQIAPLISTLIGTAVPVNNFGQLPDKLLNVSDSYLAKSLKNNANQLLEQFKYLKMKSTQGRIKFLMKSFKKLDDEMLKKFEKKIENDLSNKMYENVILESKKLMEVALEGIEFYQSYYQTPLLISISLSMVAWIISLMQRLFMSSEEEKVWKKKFIYFGSTVLLIVVSIVIYLQQISLRMGLYFVLPIICFMKIGLRKKGIESLKELKSKLILYTLLYLIITEMFVLAFFHRFILTILLITMSTFYVWSRKSTIGYKFSKLDLKWWIACMILSVFPSLPMVEKETNNLYLLIFGISIWLIKSFINSIKNCGDKHNWTTTIMFSIFSINLFLTIYFHENRTGLSYFNQIVSWIFLVLSFVLPLFSNLHLSQRFMAISDSLMIPLALMSLTYEPLFYQALSINLSYWIQIEYSHYKRNSNKPFEILTFASTTNTSRSINLNDIRRAYFILLYILISCFGTGNIASVSSFDPNWVRCLVSTFSPFLMSSLIITKLLMPILLVTCAVKAIHIVTELKMEKLFIMILIICDIMCLNFLFLVRNEGSWLEIGMSISHFVIMEVTVLVLFILYGLAHLLTTFSLRQKCCEGECLPRHKDI